MILDFNEKNVELVVEKLIRDSPELAKLLLLELQWQVPNQ